MKTLHFVCNPEVSEENTIIQSAIEQAKMKFNIPPRTAAMIKEETEFQADSVRSSVDAVLELEGAAGQNSPVKLSKTATLRFGRKYGLQPKFVKMRELHLLLFYLTQSSNQLNPKCSNLVIARDNIHQILFYMFNMIHLFKYLWI